MNWLRRANTSGEAECDGINIANVLRCESGKRLGVYRKMKRYGFCRKLEPGNVGLTDVYRLPEHEFLFCAAHDVRTTGFPCCIMCFSMGFWSLVSGWLL